MPEHKAKRIAVIGAGICGLASIKHLVDRNFDVVCYEGEDDLGGLWKFSEEERHSSVYRSTHINTSRDLNQFSDLPMPLDWDRLLHHSYILKYLNMYTDKFQLRKHIRFGTRVHSVDPVDEYEQNKWTWNIRSQTHGQPEVTDTFDAVLVCTGHHSRPRIPDFPGREKFEGTQLHSHAYKEPSPFKDKRVVVIGIGNSGSDLTAEVSKVAKDTILVSRSGSWILTNPMNPPDGQIMCGSRFDSTVFGMLPLSVQTSIWENHPMIKANHNVVKQTGLAPAHRLLQQHPTVTNNTNANNLVKQLADGRVTVKKNIKELTEDAVHFDDGSSFNADVVIYCTGYHVQYPFLDAKTFQPDEHNKAPLYQNMWLTSTYQNLVFVGMVQPVGSMFMIADIQTMVITDWLLGKFKLPDRKKMQEAVDQRQKWLAEHYIPSPRHTIQVHVREYLDELGEFNGVTPTVPRLLTQRPSALITCMKVPTVSNSYRLVGPWKLEEAPRNMLKEYHKLFDCAENRNLTMGLVKYLISLIIFVPLGIFYQLYFLVTTGKMQFHPFI